MTTTCGVGTRTRQQPKNEHDEICGAWIMCMEPRLRLERRANGDTCTKEYDDTCHVRDD